MPYPVPRSEYFLHIRSRNTYKFHAPANAMAFMHNLVERFARQIHTVHADHGRRFQAKFHRHAEGMGPLRVGSKPRTPRLNPKVERPHGAYQQEFYQLMSSTDDADFNREPAEWENYYNYRRPHRSLRRKAPY